MQHDDIMCEQRLANELLPPCRLLNRCLNDQSNRINFFFFTNINTSYLSSGSSWIAQLAPEVDGTYSLFRLKLMFMQGKIKFSVEDDGSNPNSGGWSWRRLLTLSADDFWRKFNFCCFKFEVGFFILSLNAYLEYINKMKKCNCIKPQVWIKTGCSIWNLMCKII